MTHPSAVPSLVFANTRGEIQEFDEISMAGMANRQYRQPLLTELIPLPEGSELFVLPDRFPVGTDPETGEPLLLEENPYAPDEGIQAVAAFMAPAHTAILNAAYQSIENPQRLPLFAYCAVGWFDDRFWVTGFRSDRSYRQDTAMFDMYQVEKKTKEKLAKEKDNRLIQHLGKCSLTYGCPAAKNYFLGRWEAPLPTSPHCNARCIGCISLQESGCCPSTQDRLDFVPSPREISEMAIAHILSAEKPVVSFGQGCEGEPLLQAKVIAQAIKKIRAVTQKGTINLNSNSSLPDAVRNLAKAGLDSIRVSINSVQPSLYLKYYRPKNYTFSDVINSIKVMNEYDRFVSLNYFILPGVTDSTAEFEAFCKLLSNVKIDFIQLRNLNLDPEHYLDTLDFPVNTELMTIPVWLESIKREFPSLQFGYFNPYLGT